MQSVVFAFIRMKKIKPSKKNHNRIIVVFAVFVALFTALAFRTAWHSIIMGEEYTQKASKQQTSDNLITALRGNILDRNGNQLAISADAYNVWARPSTILSNGKTEEAVELNAREEAKVLADFFGVNEDEMYASITSTSTLVKLAKNIDSDKAEELRALKLCGIEMIRNSKRYYPMSAFASQIIGITTDDNVGQTGLEYYYNSVLSGLNGRWIISEDTKGNSLVYGTNKYYEAEDGLSIVTTIDANIQRVVEEKIAIYQEKFDADRVFCIIMDPETGEILAMAQTDEFDLNNPRSARAGDESYYNTLSDSEKVNYWMRMWRNFCINDTYEPGSTFKPITAALALDYGVTDLKEKFYCEGYIKVADWKIKCWDYPRSHGYETVAEAVMNSCNPVMVQLIQRIGKTNYYNGLRTFCITEKTGIDYPGEGANQIYAEETAGPVELATMSFGQGIAVTPISLVTAFSSLVNDGKLMQPHFVKQIVNSEGELVEEIEPVVKNVTVSKETADDMITILEKVVSEGGGGKAKITGYRVGGKTGTAYKAVDGGYSETEVYTSFMGIAPMDDPQFVCLVVFDTPKNSRSASVTACPCAKEIMQEVLLYMNIQPNYSEAELAKINKTKRTVPDLSGKTLEDAIGILGGQDLEYVIAPEIQVGYQEIYVIDQYPKAGSEIDKGSAVTLYYD